MNNINEIEILLDIKLPKVNGLEVLKIIKSDPKTKMIPVVVLTTSREENDIIENYQMGVNSYIIKPVDFDKFVESIRDIGFYWLYIESASRQMRNFSYYTRQIIK